MGGMLSDIREDDALKPVYNNDKPIRVTYEIYYLDVQALCLAFIWCLRRWAKIKFSNIPRKLKPSTRAFHNLNNKFVWKYKHSY